LHVDPRDVLGRPCVFIQFQKPCGSIRSGVHDDDSISLPRLSVGRDYDHHAQPRRECVLAVWRLRRDLERFSAGDGAQSGSNMAVTAHDVTRELEELVEALDRRVPRVEHAGEAEIARDAAALRAKALDRLTELTGGRSIAAGSGRGDPT